jgi:glycyl-tRNA synthetase
LTAPPAANRLPRWLPKPQRRVGGVTPDDPALLDEVTDLVEAPQALVGTFEAKYLALPAPVLIGVMKKHQRYFPVFKDGQDVPHFIAVANAATTWPTPR